MLGLVLALIIIWIVLGIVGFAVKALSWLILVAIVLLLITLVVGGFGLRGRRPTR